MQHTVQNFRIFTVPNINYFIQLLSGSVDFIIFNIVHIHIL